MFRNFLEYAVSGYDVEEIRGMKVEEIVKDFIDNVDRGEGWDDEKVIEMVEDLERVRFFVENY